MPRARLSEMAPRVTTRNSAPLRTSSSDSDPLHNHRSPKISDRRSPKSANSDPLSQKKLGTRIAGLETQLGQAQGELKILKHQLASAEAAKKEAQKELQKRTSKPPGPVQAPDPVHVSDPVQVIRSSPSEKTQDSNNEISEETDVFEVPIEMVSVGSKIESGKNCGLTLVKVKVNGSPESPEEGIAVEDEEISVLKLKVEEKEQKLQAFNDENASLKRQLSEANAKISTAMVNEEKMSLNLTRIEEEFEKSKRDGVRLTERLREVEAAKEALEVEMKRLRVQTDQWRKAADAAAAILAGGAERCGSVDKGYGGVFDGFDGSMGLGDESDDGFGTGKRKGSGIRMFGDLWKKKGQK